MKPSVDPELCIGCGSCEMICPEVFRVEDDGIAHVIAESPGPDFYDCTREAEDACPVSAISIAE